MADEIKRIRRELTALLRKTYSTLTPWQTVLVSRHPERPQTMDYAAMIFDEFVELHGDRAFGDDRAIRCGFARLGNFKVLLVGHQKGHTLKERQACYYGCAHPEGYRKALNKMRLAAKFRIPIVCLIDTPGAFPGIGAEERGQAQLIATSILEMSRLSGADHLRGDRRGRVGRGTRHRCRRSSRHAGARLLLGHQSGGVRRDTLERQRPTKPSRERRTHSSSRRPT